MSDDCNRVCLQEVECNALRLRSSLGVVHGAAFAYVLPAPAGARAWSAILEASRLSSVYALRSPAPAVACGVIAWQPYERIPHATARRAFEVLITCLRARRDLCEARFAAATSWYHSLVDGDLPLHRDGPCWR